MSRYIDADKLTKKMERRYEDMRLTYGECDQFNMGYAEGMVAIDNAPTADVVEVVRCKDCIYNSNGSCTHSEIYDDTNVTDEIPNEFAFCVAEAPETKRERIRAAERRLGYEQGVKAMQERLKEQRFSDATPHDYDLLHCVIDGVAEELLESDDG